MTNPTPHGQVPAIQRYKIGYATDDWGMRSSTPSGIPDQAGAWVRYEDHVAAMVEAQQPASHVQNPAEIEHVAGDVSKNGAELSMSAQQPAPAQPAPQQEAASAGFFMQLPQRPKPEAPAGTVGLDWDAYSGAQMLAYGRDCSNAAIVARDKVDARKQGANHD